MKSKQKILKRVLRSRSTFGYRIIDRLTDDDRSPFALCERVVMAAELQLALRRRTSGPRAVARMKAAYPSVVAKILAGWSECAVASYRGERLQPTPRGC